MTRLRHSGGGQGVDKRVYCTIVKVGGGYN